ncbi:MAG: aromatic ring-hydroxylating dioxygenase subunit alpha [Acidobacteriota bacterium]
MSRHATPLSRATDLFIDPDIRHASTLPASFYRDADLFTLMGERIFARSWQWVADHEQLRIPGTAHPVTLLPGYVDEPLVLTRDRDDRLACLSNVCTHRGTVVVEHPCQVSQLRCRYHGRRFTLDGRFVAMPEFDDVHGFPSKDDDLSPIALASWGPLYFASLDPAHTFEELIAPINERVGFLPLDRATFDAASSRDYLVRAHWALYCDNYLEGFHIPFVHNSLAAALDYGEYRTELFAHANLQLGTATGDDDTFALPSGHPDAGANVAAYYFWLFPNTMLNVYPWGVSVNIVQPLAIDRTRVSFRSYVWAPERRDQGAGADLDRVEREDEAIVESVHRGMGGRFYRRGRYSPRRERGVHHFHRLLTTELTA